MGVPAIQFEAIKFEKSDPMRGGFAIVRIAKWVNKDVAVKSQVKHPDDVIQEVKILHQICSHPNIVGFCGIST